jgi:AraC-like DNA-binding protein
MALVLDTTTMAPRERPEAVRAAMRYARVPALLVHETEERVHARMHTWDLGRTAMLMRRTGTGLTLRRTPGQVRQVAEDRYGLVVPGPGRWSFVQHRDERREIARESGLLMVDQSAPYEFGRFGDGATYSVNVDRQALGLPHDVVHRAATRLHTSPLRRLVVDHVLTLTRDADDIERGPGLSMVGAATVDLFRALLLSAAGRDPAPLDDDAAALVRLTKQYIRRHYTDPGLDPGRIARAHAVSVRRLYAAWAGDPQTPAEHIMAVRLNAARVQLSVPGPRPRTIAAVAAACGFVDATHFARRFRQAYGMTPREWRAQA